MVGGKNIVWINTVRAICIILVYFCHSMIRYGLELSIVSKLYAPFFVNAFFFVSGYLLFRKQLSLPEIGESKLLYMSRIGGGYKLLLNIIFRIAVPSIIFSIIEFVPSCLIQGWTITLPYALLKTIGGGTFWFTSTLAVSELLLLLMFCSRKKSVWFYTIICCVTSALAVCLIHYGIGEIKVWGGMRGLLALSLIALGGIYWKYEPVIDKILKLWVVVLVAIGYVLIVLFRPYSNPITVGESTLPLDFVVSAIACVLIVWLSKKLPEIKAISYIGKNSIGFYFMSGGVPTVLGVLARQLFGAESLAVLLMVFIVSFCLSYAIVIALNRYLPWLFDLRKRCISD